VRDDRFRDIAKLIVEKMVFIRIQMIPVTGEACGCVESIWGDYWISRLQRLSHKY
jgi:hypothetical protein